MDKVTFAFIGLVLILILGAFYQLEGFTNTSDSSGTKITVSLSDLVTLFASTKPTATTTTSSVSTPTTYNPTVPVQTQFPSESTPTYDQQFYSNLKTQLLDDVRHSVRKELRGSSLSKGDESCGMVSDTCINSFVNQQGSDFMKYIPGKNPSDYIRKDSIPCYGCNLA
jgi:hypothetical protein